ncbi:MAG: ABC transporter substrate-binding protein [Dermatophilus congolensis]|nr:ABC transporter substrate-binding protein [Dermatophilus congolensis]
MAATSLLLTACGGGESGGGATGGSGGGKTLVIDRAFDLKSADPARSYEHTGNTVAHALYDTLLTFKGDDVTKPEPDLATVENNAEFTEFTVKLQGQRHFSDGAPITADDVTFSLQRVQGVKGSPSFLLDGVKIEKVDDTTVKLTTDKPTPALPYILPNPALGIVNKKVVESNGGSTTPQDGAEAFLNATSAGSGPYTIESLDLKSQVVFTANPNYDGPKKPALSRIVMRNVETASQAVNIKSGDSMLALDLTGDQVKGMPDNIKVTSGPSANVIFLLLNQSPSVNKWTSNPDFVKAVKAAIDYDALLEVAGEGSVQAAGVIPSMFLGALDKGDALTYDAAAAATALAASGYNGDKVPLNYPNDITLNGVQFTSVAERIQAQLSKAGINVELAPAPVATELDAYRTGKENIGLWYWGPDYPDPADYLVFTPGDLVGKRAMWEAGADPTLAPLVDKARAGGSDEERKAAFQAVGKRLNEAGPFVPLLQPAVNLAAASTLTNVVYNPVWTIDFADIGTDG